MKKALHIKSILMATTGCGLVGFASIVSAVSCGDTITTAEVLDADIINCAASPAITVTGPTGSLDLNGFTLSCDGSAIGILLDGSFAGLSNSQPSSGTIRACDTAGISVEGTGFHTIVGVTTSENGALGVSVSSDNNFFNSSSHTDNQDTGIYISGDENSFFSVDASGNLAAGIAIFGDYTRISQSIADNNDIVGIILINANYTSVIQNTASSNGEYGILVDDTGPVGNIILGNQAQSNIIRDMFDDSSSPCVGTTWFANDFNTSNESCIE
ncbi:right-handed parallel beta-helix repeat-containing protein [Microbulbifer sp. SSSA002]|uniref:right-handed parallel beta-helix repeat-containing protein n=1 Tax=Microbulbifer sp. SSSA002 TaxID=3243376 RepID=UPI004039AD94